MTISGGEVDRLITGLGISVEMLWLGYLHDGGTITCGQIERFIGGEVELDDDQREVLVEVILRRVLGRRARPRPERGRLDDVEIDLTSNVREAESTAAWRPSLACTPSERA